MPPSESMRLQKFLSRAGVASRRKSEDLIRAGRIRVDGVVVTELGTSVDPGSQTVEFDGSRVEIRATEWLALHKPPGVACTRSDPGGRPTIYDFIPASQHHLFHVGRLDYMSEGLLLLSNEGDLVHRLLHPSNELSRVYRVRVLAPVARDLPERLVAGVDLDDGPARAVAAKWVAGPESRTPEVELTLTEGRNREIRRMLAALEVKIRRLQRVAFGPIGLGDLAAGDVRQLSKEEKAQLEACSNRAG